MAGAAAARRRIVLALCVALVVVASSAEEIACGGVIPTCVDRLVEANSEALLKVQDDDEVAVSFKSVDCCKTIVEKRGKACGCRLRNTLLNRDLHAFGTADFCVPANVCNK